MKKSTLAIIISILIALAIYTAYLVFSKNSENEFISGINTQSTSTSNNTSSQTQTETRNITITFPREGNVIASNLTVRGQGRVFESQLNVRILANGKKLNEVSVMTNALDVGLFGDYEAKFDLSKYKLKSGQEVEVMAFDYSAKDGTEENQFIIKVIYNPTNGLTPTTFNELGASLWHPKNWKPDHGYKINDLTNRYGINNEFFMVNAIGSPLLTLDEVAKNEANHKLKPYGSNPEITKEIVNGREARFIFPLQDQSPEMKGQSAFIIKYPSPITIENQKYNYFILYADRENVKKIAETVDFLYQTVEVYFNNNLLDPEISCDKVFPVKRTVFKNGTPAQSAIEELLKGPSDIDKAGGYQTNINPGVKIQKLAIKNATAEIDFNNALQEGVGGSCKVTAIRSQITQTLKQFPTIKNVIISINGNSEMILQP